jgi:hypothetical protein
LLLRLLLFFCIAYIFYAVLKAYWLARKAHHRNSRFVDPRKGDDMVLDPQCQTYVPKNEAIAQEGNYFCSRECARLFLSR